MSDDWHEEFVHSIFVAFTQLKLKIARIADGGDEMASHMVVVTYLVVASHKLSIAILASRRRSVFFVLFVHEWEHRFISTQYCINFIMFLLYVAKESSHDMRTAVHEDLHVVVLF